MRIIAVSNQKGGAGKTTTLMNLAAVTGKSARVLVVDVDPQRSASEWAETAGERLPFDFDSSTDVSMLSRLRELPYDIIFVDTPGNLEGTDILKAVLDVSDFVVVPVNPEPLTVGPTRRTIN